jgi:hypothetical protein
VEPEDGAAGVLSDSPVVIHLSCPVEPASLGPETLRLLETSCAVPCRREAIAGGRVLVLWPRGRLHAGVEHIVDIVGLRDREGREFRPHRTRFTPGPLGRPELTI